MLLSTLWWLLLRGPILLLLPLIDGSKPNRDSKVTMRLGTALAVVLVVPGLVLVILG